MALQVERTRELATLTTLGLGERQQWALGFLETGLMGTVAGPARAAPRLAPGLHPRRRHQRALLRLDDAPRGRPLALRPGLPRQRRRGHARLGLPAAAPATPLAGRGPEAGVMARSRCHSEELRSAPGDEESACPCPSSPSPSPWPLSSSRSPARPRSRRLAGPRLELGPGPDLSGFARATAVAPVRPPRATTARTSSTRPSGGTTPATSPPPTAAASASSSRSSAAASPPALRPTAPASPRTRSTSPTSRSRTWPRAATPRPSASRAARAGLAGATGEPFAVWLEDWRADSLNADGSAVRLVARDAATGLSLDLELRATKPLVAHGDRGLSPKSDEPGNASYYVGYTRMAARGRIGTRTAPAAPPPGARSRSPAKPGSTTSGARARSARAPSAGTGSRCSSTTAAS